MDSQLRALRRKMQAHLAATAAWIFSGDPGLPRLHRQVDVKGILGGISRQRRCSPRSRQAIHGAASTHSTALPMNCAAPQIVAGTWTETPAQLRAVLGTVLSTVVAIATGMLPHRKPTHSLHQLRELPRTHGHWTVCPPLHLRPSHRLLRQLSARMQLRGSGRAPVRRREALQIHGRGRPRARGPLHRSATRGATPVRLPCSSRQRPPRDRATPGAKCAQWLPSSEVNLGVLYGPPFNSATRSQLLLLDPRRARSHPPGRKV